MDSEDLFTCKLIDSLYTEALVLADEARLVFELLQESTMSSSEPSDTQQLVDRTWLSCESLRVTTRIMHSVAWLMNRKAWMRGEFADDDLILPKYALGESHPADMENLSQLSDDMADIVQRSDDLYNRLHKLDAAQRDLLAQRLCRKYRNGTVHGKTATIDAKTAPFESNHPVLSMQKKLEQQLAGF